MRRRRSNSTTQAWQLLLRESVDRISAQAFGTVADGVAGLASRCATVIVSADRTSLVLRAAALQGVTAAERAVAVDRAAMPHGVPRHVLAAPRGDRVIAHPSAIPAVTCAAVNSPRVSLGHVTKLTFTRI